jgi:hypothetical protein
VRFVGVRFDGMRFDGQAFDSEAIACEFDCWAVGSLVGIQNDGRFVFGQLQDGV